MKAETYLDKINELLKVYSTDEIARAIGVSGRSVQNYTTQVNPRVPHKDTLRRIDEIFTKHRAGDPIVEPKSPGHGQDFKDRYINQLEKSVKVEEELRGVRVSLDQLTVDMVALNERVLQGQRELFRELTDFFRKSGSNEVSPGAKRQRSGKS